MLLLPPAWEDDELTMCSMLCSLNKALAVFFYYFIIFIFAKVGGVWGVGVGWAKIKQDYFIR